MANSDVDEGAAPDLPAGGRRLSGRCRLQRRQVDAAVAKVPRLRLAIVKPERRREGLRRLAVFNQLGDLERCALRPSNVHSAEGWRSVLEPVIARYRGRVKRLHFRGDAALCQPADLRVPRSRRNGLCDQSDRQLGVA